jgi:iron complex outermembrane receptor protein
MVTAKDRHDISLSQISGLPDILRGISGIDPRQRGPFGIQADISIRGGTFEQTMILFNGVNISDPQTGHNSLNIPVDLDDIERIEIIKGPAAKTFGPNAFNGVINIIAGNQTRNAITVRSNAGMHGSFKTGATISSGTDKLSSYLSYNRQSSEGYIKNTDFFSDNLYMNARLNSGRFISELQAGMMKKEFGANSFYSLRFPEQFEALQNSFISLKTERTGQLKVSLTGYYRYNTDRFELIRNSSLVPFNHHLTRIAGMNLNGSYKHKFGTLNLGYELRNENILSNILGFQLNNPLPVRGYDNALYTKSHNRLNTSIFAENYLTAGKLNVNTGALLYFNSDYGTSGFYPGIDIAYGITKSVKLYASANPTLRMPSFTEMFYSSPVQKGNSALKPEKAFTLEGGIKMERSNFIASAALFRREGKELIDWVKNASPDSLIWRSSNHARVDISGLEASISYFLRGFESPDRRRSVGLSVSLLDSDTYPDSLLSRYVFDYLRSKFVADIHFWVTGNFHISGNVTYSDRNGGYQGNSGSTVMYPPFWVTDIKFVYASDKITLHLGASNLLNTKWYDFGGIIQPGIWINSGVVIRI